MKLSEMTTTQLADCLVSLTVPVANIAEDDEVITTIKAIAVSYKTKSVAQVGAEVITKLVPLALKKHRTDVLAILAALTGKTASALGAQNAFETIKEAKGAIDKELIDFFTSLAGTAKSA